MKKPDKLIRENIRSLIPYSSARDDFQGNAGIFLDANENPYGTLNRYPDPYHRELKSMVSKLKGIKAENIFFGNGSDEVIDLLCRVFCNPGADKVLTFTPTYGMYEVTATVNDLTVVRVPLDMKFDIEMEKVKGLLKDERLRMIFICSPNNPTANTPDRETVVEIIKNFRGIVVIDEAYIDFSDKPSFLPLAGKFENLVVIQTFSKAWGAAAARVGMAFADERIIRYLYRIKPPYNISTINQKAVINRLKTPEKYYKQVFAIKQERKRVESRLKKIDLVENIYPSDANFLLVKVKDANRIYRLLADNNIIVRNRSSVVNNCLRITIGTRKENDALISELRKINI